MAWRRALNLHLYKVISLVRVRLAYQARRLRRALRVLAPGETIPNAAVLF
jgi:hypothetical protein